MKPLGPQEIRSILATTDALGIHRESVRVPLGRRGIGSVQVTAAGDVEIVAPEEVGFEDWVVDLAAKLAALDLSRVRRVE